MNKLRYVRILWGFSLGIAILMSAVLAIRNPLNLILMFIISLVWLVGRMLLGFLRGHDKAMAMFFILAVLNLVIAVPELILRAADFRYEAGIYFAVLRPSFQSLFVPDKDLLWKLSPSKPNVNSLGFPGEEVERPKPKGVFRIVFLGDSCTRQGFPRIVERLLNHFFGTDSLRFECVTLAVSGYSSYQGKVMAEMYGRMFEPDLVVVLFGWNDHWQAYRSIDSKTKSILERGVLRNIYHNCRLLQFLRKAIVPLARKKGDGILNQVRVSAAEYKDNLSAISRLFKSDDVPVLLLTSPTSHYRLGVPEYFIKEKLTPSAEKSIRLHREYNKIVRDLASEYNLMLLDLETDFDTLQDIEQVFSGDGVHFTSYGLEIVAQRIFEFIKYGNLIKRRAS